MACSISISPAITTAACCIKEMGDDMMWEIFCRLPTKTCMKCKLVCKRWYALIMSPEFSTQRRASGRYASLLFVAGRHPHMMLLDLDRTSTEQQMEESRDERVNLIVPDDDTKILLKDPGFRRRRRRRRRGQNARLQPVNECNGLLCFKTTKYGRLANPSCWWGSLTVCNLLTAQHVTVKQPPRAGYKPVSFGLGYSPASHQYKMLRILKPTMPGWPWHWPDIYTTSSPYVAEVVTLGTGGGWRCVDENAPKGLSFQLNAFLNASLHGWCRSSNQIWAFDFDTEQFSLVPLSPEITSDGHVILSVSTFQSSSSSSFLCCSTTNYLLPVLLNDDDSVSHVWIMKEYGNKDSWVKLYVSPPWLTSRPLFQRINGTGHMLIHFVDEKLDPNSYHNDVFGACCSTPSFTGRYYSLPVLQHLLYVLACDTTYSLLPMKQLMKQEHPHPPN